MVFLKFLRQILGAVPEPWMVFLSGFKSPPTKIALSLVATLGDSIAGKSTSLLSIAKLCATLAVGSLIWPFNIQVPHQIFLHSRE